jgi:hypothetical protein
MVGAAGTGDPLYRANHVGSAWSRYAACPGETLSVGRRKRID